jgi:hypothetical protein
VLLAPATAHRQGLGTVHRDTIARLLNRGVHVSRSISAKHKGLPRWDGRQGLPATAFPRIT